MAVFLGACVWGYNPYVTNSIYRHNLFYPQSGSKAYPSLDDQGTQGIELHETPRNFLPHNRLTRLFLATFGRPGNQPYHHEPNSQLMWPFAARWADLFYYHYHETRLAGFGPWFSGALLLSLGLAAWLLWMGYARMLMILVAMTIMASLLSSPYFWWARYGPQLWLLPVLPVIFVFWSASSPWQLYSAWILVALLTINASIVTVVRLKWETNASLAMRRQLRDLQQTDRDIVFYVANFSASIEGRLKAWGIPYKLADAKQVGNGPRLLTIVDDYPSPVRYRLHPRATTGPAK